MSGSHQFLQDRVWRLRGVLLVVIGLLSLPLVTRAQIVSSEQAVGLRAGGMRSAIQLPTLRLGAFDQDSALVAMEQTEETLRLYTFAHKQLTSVDVIQEGHHFTTPSGTRVWQYRVMSPGAKSLSFFFDQFELPEGAVLFVLDSFSPEEVRMGGFGAENNSESGTLPTQAILSDDVVIEVQAPEGTALPKLRLAEVNHGLRDLLRATGPAFGGKSQGTYTCTPELSCYPEYEQIGRSVVMVIIDGTALGTGVMVNNTSGDGTPYLLTASHVVSWNFKSAYRDYVQRSEKVVLYFNYVSPSCSGEVRPQTVQSLAGGKLVGVDEENDAVMIEMHHRPPADYKPYYAGWDASATPVGRFVNIHHPNSLTKRINFFQGYLSLVDYPGRSKYPFAALRHWKILSWDIGTTAYASSGSPLYDGNKRVIGGLSGGHSYCDSRASDYFFALNTLWASDAEGAKRIVAALDPSGQKQLSCDGMELFTSDATRAVRITHMQRSLVQESILEQYPQLPRGQLLGSDLEATHIAERYLLRKGSKVFGAYVVLSLPKGLSVANRALPPVELSFFVGEETQPKAQFQLSLAGLSENVGASSDLDKPALHELYVSLPEPVVLPQDGELFMAVATKSLPEGVEIFHQQHTSEPRRNTLFYRTGNEWTSATEQKRSSSLWVDPVVSEAELDKMDTAHMPLVTLTATEGGNVIFRFAERVGHDTVQFEILTLLGERLYEEELKGLVHFFPRSMMEGRGIVLLRFRTKGGGEQQVIKAYFPKN